MDDFQFAPKQDIFFSLGETASQEPTYRFAVPQDPRTLSTSHNPTPSEPIKPIGEPSEELASLFLKAKATNSPLPPYTKSAFLADNFYLYFTTLFYLAQKKDTRVVPYLDLLMDIDNASFDRTRLVKAYHLLSYFEPERCAPDVKDSLEALLLRIKTKLKEWLDQVKEKIRLSNDHSDQAKKDELTRRLGNIYFDIAVGDALCSDDFDYLSISKLVTYTPLLIRGVNSSSCTRIYNRFSFADILELSPVLTKGKWQLELKVPVVDDGKLKFGVVSSDFHLLQGFTNLRTERKASVLTIRNGTIASNESLISMGDVLGVLVDFPSQVISWELNGTTVESKPLLFGSVRFAFQLSDSRWELNLGQVPLSYPNPDFVQVDCWEDTRNAFNAWDI